MNRILICLSLVFFSVCKNTIEPYPKLTGPVIDPNHYLPSEIKSQLETILLSEEKITSNQVVVYIAESMEEDTIEKEASAVFEYWKLGRKDKDNGILLLLAPKERKVRIEVGYGLEGVLTDLVAKRIIDELIIPNMKSGNPSLAMLSGTNAILEQLRYGSPKLTNEFCPKQFSDINSDLHPDTIPFLLKEIKPLKEKIYFFFCVVPAENQLGLETAANQLYLHLQKSNKKSIIFVTSPKNDYMGTIILEPEFNWLISQNKVRSIFFNRYSEKRNSDFTNFTYRAFIDMLDHLKHSQKIAFEKGSGIFDPYDALEKFSYDRALETIQKLEQEYKVGIQILFLDTKPDLTQESKKFHELAFGTTTGITLLFSLNQKKFHVYTNETSKILFAGQMVPKAIEKETLTEIIHTAITSELKSADIDWMCIRSAEAIDHYLDLLKYQKPLGEENQTNPSTEMEANQTKVLEPHFLFHLFFMLMFFVIWIGLASGEGILFFYGLFFVLGQIMRSKFYLLPSAPNIYQSILVFSSAILSYVFVNLFRKIGWAETVGRNTQDFFTPSSSGTSSSSGSGYRSSSSSYSGGGGRSGGGGASGSW
ncbi:PF04536 family protein [Leptospira yanagawae serovar Saopaulo str. Sao Paulo = ATCC 700523]|uniref:PF04536 family protein n=1 Tax=Leptospira yanagawae serovar Saopaulo str. Sao Paulo = ATCC 700523 TaxID=1249483 RepID=A0A5E8HDF9_9LEPT|nr:TPM domain-containing protein [Leptospira yanagawae]EOQ88530.1 PF04536 family protein [Leptospira yanagawae serovar Saopaulo str. Sao Paulo = ATCC 700523]